MRWQKSIKTLFEIREKLTHDLTTSNTELSKSKDKIKRTQ